MHVVDSRHVRDSTDVLYLHSLDFMHLSVTMKTLTGMIPILHSPGLMMPGQLGPISLVLTESFKMRFTLTCTKPEQSAFLIVTQHSAVMAT